MADPLHLKDSPRAVGATLTLWRFRDGKPGHERQTAGLVAALSRHRQIVVHDIDVRRERVGLRHWLSRRFPGQPSGPNPDFLIGAGRACQWPMLAARRAVGGRAIYCMKPGLPVRCFDLCFVPQHDGARRSARIEPTLGVLNDIAARAPDQPGDSVLILVGGPSRHHGWEEDGFLDRLSTLIPRLDAPVVLADSRRTPASTRARLAALAGGSLTYVASDTTSAGWLAAVLGGAREVWVSEDSVSMIFEALTAGVPVGLLPVPARRTDRITRLAPLLQHSGKVTGFTQWLRGETLKAPAPPLAEATRCAEVLLERFG